LDDDDSVVWNLYTHFELGEEFKDTIIPHALYWYTGEAALDESSDDGDEENGDDDDDDDKDNEDR
jgi:nucleosome assembly protein 1-like 1